MGKGRDKVFKREDVEPKKKEIELGDFCNEVTYDHITRLISKGSVLVLLANGEHAPMKEFYKAIYNEMRRPVFNGACIYDAKIPFNDAWERATVLITLNDVGNWDIVERIQILGPLKHRTLYSNLRGDL